MRVQHSRLCGWRRRYVRCELSDRAFAERAQNPLANSPQWIAHVALRILLALLALVRRARGDGNWTVDRLNDVRNGNLRRYARQLVPTSRSLLGREKPAPHQPLQNFGKQFDRNVVELRDFARTGRSAQPARTAITAHGEMLHRHQRV